MNNDPLVEQMKQALAKNGYVPNAQAPASNDWYSQIKSTPVETQTPSANPAEAFTGNPNPNSPVSAFSPQPGATVTSPTEFAKGAVKEVATTGMALDTGLQNVGNAVLHPINTLQGKDTPGSGFDTLKSGTQANQEAKDLYTPNNLDQKTGAVTTKVASTFVPLGEGKSAVQAVAPLVEKGVNAVKGAKAAANIEKATQATIDAINPESTGAKLAKNYKEVVTSNRTVKPSGVFSEQTLSPSERAITTGTRMSTPVQLSDGTALKPVQLTNNSAKNLTILKNSLNETEAKLTDALNKESISRASGGGSSLPTADKPGLTTKLVQASKSAPEEFRIGDASKMFDSVFKFANKVAQGSEDSIKGLREARRAFDVQAETQYPSAFKDGAIDTKTPAGAAIKKARDIFNEHLYNTAPNGSDIQKLIGREADILQSSEYVAAKAAKGEGKSKLNKAADLVKEHPIVTGVGSAAATYGTIKGLGF